MKEVDFLDLPLLFLRYCFGAILSVLGFLVVALADISVPIFYFI